MAKGKRLENKHQNENLEEERLRFDDQAGRGIGKLGLLQCLKEVEFTPEQINHEVSQFFDHKGGAFAQGAAKAEPEEFTTVNKKSQKGKVRMHRAPRFL